MHPLREFENYTILGDIAEGGMGMVHQAVHRGLNRPCALKLIRAGVLATPDERRRFVTEAEAAARLDHPNIVRVLRAGEHEGQWFLEMELVEGGTLADRIAQGAIPPREAAALIEPLARAVQHAHERGILHRDLKPANVLLGSDGQPKLADFGLARFLEKDSDLTRTLAVLGTPAYLAPELASGRARAATTAADIYSLGVILFECLTGQRPFRGQTALELLRAVQETTTPRPSSLREGLPRDMEVIALRCLAKEPARRFASAGELADELKRFLQDEPIHSRPVSVVERIWLWSRRQPAVAALVLAVAGGLGVSAWLLVREAAARQREAAILQVSELGKADLATRSGRWSEALAHWDAARRAGYPDDIALGLKRAEAWIVLQDRAKARAIFNTLRVEIDRGVPGRTRDGAGQSSSVDGPGLPVHSSARGPVLLRVGEFEMFDRATFQQGMDHVREALTNGLGPADAWLARGLLTNSTPGALDAFRRALELDPYLHSAHRHSLGLEFALGRHEELAAHLRVAKALYPGDFSAGAIELCELALHGRLAEAQAALAGHGDSISEGTRQHLERGIRMLAMAVDYFDVEAYLGERTNTVSRTELLSEALQLLQTRNDGAATNTARSPLPSLPCVEQGVRAGFEGLQSLTLAGLLGGAARIEAAVDKVRTGHRHHPEALFPTFCGVSLNQQHPRSGARDPRWLAIQSEMFQLGADSPSILPQLGRLARVLAVDVQEELARSPIASAASYRASCLTNLHRATLDPRLTPVECRTYSRWCLGLGELDLNRMFLARWTSLRPDDPVLLRHRIRLELASGAYGRALELIDRALAADPDDRWAKSQSEQARRGARRMLQNTSEPRQETSPR